MKNFESTEQKEKLNGKISLMILDILNLIGTVILIAILTRS